MAVSGYQAGGVYNLSSYTGILGALFGGPVLWMAGASLSSPIGSNLPAPSAVGRYGAFVGGAGANNFFASATSTESKQLPMRFGKNHAFITFANKSRAGGVGSLTPAYGN
jgi:hypothetical protein